jgi:hypothetical protein
MVICGSSRRSLPEPRFAEPVALVGLEVQRGHVVEHQRRRPQRRVRRARCGQPLPPRVLGVDRQAPVHRGIRRRRDTGLVQHPQRVQLAGRLDDPRQHQLPEHLITAGRLAEPQRVVGAAQGIPQEPQPGAQDRQRTRRRRRAQAERQLALTGREPLPRGGLQRLQLLLVMGRPQVLDTA